MTNSTNSELHFVDFSPDVTIAVTGGQLRDSELDPWRSVVTLWNVSTGEELRTFEGSDFTAFSPDAEFVLSASFSPDGRRVLTGSLDRTAKLWDTVTGRELRTFPHGGHANSVAFSPDGTKVLTSGNGVALLWEISDLAATSGISSGQWSLY